MPEVRSVKAAVAREQPVSLAECVRADQKIGSNSRPLTAASAVCSPPLARLERRFRSGRAEFKSQPTHRLFGCGRRGIISHKLGPHYLGGHKRAFSKGGSYRVRGTPPEDGIWTQDIQQYASVDSRYHFSGPGPRSSSIISSVRRPSFRLPNNSSTTSREGRFASTSLPLRSLTSSTCPVRRPSRMRSGLGMVIWPFSEMVVFIPLRYEFLLGLSRRD